MKKYLVAYTYNAGLLGADRIYNTLEEVKEFENWYVNHFNDCDKYYIVMEITTVKKFLRTTTTTQVIKTWAEE